MLKNFGIGRRRVNKMKNSYKIMQEARSRRLIPRCFKILGFFTAISIFFLSQFGPAVLALSSEQRKLFDSGIYYFDTESSAACQPDNGCACQVGGTIGLSDSVVDNLSAFTPDPATEKMFNETLVPQIKKFIPLYQQAAQEEGVPLNWEILAGLHGTETRFGLKWIGNGVQTVTGPFQQQTSELSTYLNDPEYSDLKTLIGPGGSLIGAGRDVTDKEFVVLARLAFHRWINQALGAGYDELKTKPVAFQSTVDSNNTFWKIMGRWNDGAQGYQGFTGYNNTNYKMPQPITGVGAGGMWDYPGSATIYYLIKKNGISGGSTSCVDESGNLQPISGDRAELAKRLLDNPSLVLGTFGNASTQKSDIEGVVTDDLVRLMVAATEQSGAKLLVNALKSDHDPGSAHEAGKAVDIGYFGNGQPTHTIEGNKMYTFLYNNRVGLKIKQLIWQYPPDGYKCINRGQPVDCSTYGSVLDDHYHHIHAGI